jgi:hypothetical protein
MERIDRGVQHASIGRERLQAVEGAAGAHERDEIVGADFPIDERVQCLARAHETLHREPEIVDDDGKGALDVFAPDLRGSWHARRGRGRRRIVRWRSGGSREDRHEFGERDFLDLAVLPDLEIGGGQIGDDAAVAVDDDRINADRINRDPEALRLLALLCGKHRDGEQRDEESRTEHRLAPGGRRELIMHSYLMCTSPLKVWNLSVLVPPEPISPRAPRRFPDL